jgi:predicted AAA+ superfamily ATPase
MFNRSTWLRKKDSKLDKQIDSILKKTKTDEVQGRIAKDIFFRFNSVNVIIGQRGSGKTHFVLREVLKLLQYPEANYSMFLYSSNKIVKDDTVEKFLPLFKNFPLEIQIINHDETPAFIDAIAEARKE